MSVLVGIAAAAAAALAADFAYARVMRRQWRRWERRQTRDADGLRAGCRPFAMGEGATAILLVHGFGSSPAAYSRMAPALAERGFHARAMRLPGFGEPLEKLARVTRHDWIAAVRDELRALRAAHARVWVVGQSMGAAAAAAALLEDPGLADGAAFLAPCFGVSGRRSPLLPARWWFAALRRILVFSDVFGQVFPPDARDPEAAEIERGDRFIPRRTYEELFALLDETAPRAGSWTRPLLMIVAPRDRVADPAAARAFFEAVPHPAKRFVSVTASGHVVSLDVEWKRVAEELETFIARTSDG